MASYERLPPSPGRSSDSDSPPPPTAASLRDLELDMPPPPRPRTGTLSAVDFTFDRTFVPLTLSDGLDGDLPVSGKTEKHVGLVDGVALVIGMQVGSGIFSSPGVILADVGSPGLALIVWIFAGLLAWSGASSFAELGSAIPLNGGSQAYLAYAFGPLVSFLFSWTAITLLKPGSAAIIALVFGEYVNRLIYHSTVPLAPGLTPVEIPEWTHKATATIAVIVVSLVQAVNARAGTSVQTFLTLIKICSLLFVIVLGLVALIRNGPGLSLAPDNLFKDSSSSPGAFAVALYSGLWAFDGWDQTNYVAGEMHNVSQDLPRVIHFSMALVTLLFAMANISYFVVLDRITVASSNTVALDYGRAMLGPVGGVVFSVLVAISCYGALNGSIYTSSRLVAAAGRDQFMPELFGRFHPTRKTPINAMALQTALTVGFVLFGGGFRTLVNIFSVGQWLFYFLTVLGLLLLRVKEPYLERPYKTYLFTPIIFCAVALFLLCMPITAAPWEALAAFAFIFTGVPLYWVRTHSLSPSSASGGRTDGGEGLWQRLLESAKGWVGGLHGGRGRGSGEGRRGDGEERREMLRSHEMGEVR